MTNTERLNYASAGAVRRREPSPQPLDLRAETIALARKFKTRADELDEAFIRHCDPRALQGGAICEEANTYRSISRQLCSLACKID